MRGCMPRAARLRRAVAAAVGPAAAMTATGDSIPSIIAKQLHETTAGDPKRGARLGGGQRPACSSVQGTRRRSLMRPNNAVPELPTTRRCTCDRNCWALKSTRPR